MKSPAEVCADYRYLTPWRLRVIYTGQPEWTRRFLFYRVTEYVARVASINDWYCVYSSAHDETSTSCSLISELKEHIDKRLIERGHVLLTESQVKAMELLK